MTEIRKQYEKFDFNNLIYYFKGNTSPINFFVFKGSQHIFKNIYNGGTALEDVEKEQNVLKKN